MISTEYSKECLQKRNIGIQCHTLTKSVCCTLRYIWFVRKKKRKKKNGIWIVLISRRWCIIVNVKLYFAFYITAYLNNSQTRSKFCFCIINPEHRFDFYLIKLQKSSETIKWNKFRFDLLDIYIFFFHLLGAVVIISSPPLFSWVREFFMDLKAFALSINSDISDKKFLGPSSWCFLKYLFPAGNHLFLTEETLVAEWFCFVVFRAWTVLSIACVAGGILVRGVLSWHLERRNREGKSQSSGYFVDYELVCNIKLVNSMCSQKISVFRSKRRENYKGL